MKLLDQTEYIIYLKGTIKLIYKCWCQFTLSLAESALFLPRLGIASLFTFYQAIGYKCRILMCFHNYLKGEHLFYDFMGHMWFLSCKMLIQYFWQLFSWLVCPFISWNGGDAYIFCIQIHSNLFVSQYPLVPCPFILLIMFFLC